MTQACDRLLAAAAQLGGSNDQAKKLADEIAKRLPAVKTKLESLPQVEPVTTLLQNLAASMEGRDVQRAAEVYAEAQQRHHKELGSTGMLALKRCADLIKKA